MGTKNKSMPNLRFTESGHFDEGASSVFITDEAFRRKNYLYGINELSISIEKAGICDSQISHFGRKSSFMDFTKILSQSKRLICGVIARRISSDEPNLQKPQTRRVKRNGINMELIHELCNIF